MTQLANLLEIDGVVGALRFQDDGALIEAVGEPDQIFTDMAATFCFANNRISYLNSDLLTALSEQTGWAPRGWMMIGGDLTICTIANVACFIKNDNAALNKTINTLYTLSE